jgi:hypothetical protein
MLTPEPTPNPEEDLDALLAKGRERTSRSRPEAAAGAPAEGVESPAAAAGAPAEGGEAPAHGTITGEHHQPRPFLTVEDAAWAIPRGIEEAAHDLYGLADIISLDLLPDWDEQRITGHAESTAGDVAVGLAQFAAGFMATGGIATAVGLGAKAAAGAGALARFGGALAKGAVTDFAFFDGQGGRLSDMLEGTFMENDLTRRLQSSADDSELDGRLKNAIEGLGLGALTDGLLLSFRKIGAINAERTRRAAEGVTATDKQLQAAADAVETPDFKKNAPSEEALREAQAGREAATETTVHSEIDQVTATHQDILEIEDLSAVPGSIPEVLAEPLRRAGINNIKEFMEQLRARDADQFQYAGKTGKTSIEEGASDIQPNASNLLNVSEEEAAAVVRAMESLNIMDYQNVRKSTDDIIRDANAEKEAFFDDATTSSQGEQDAFRNRVDNETLRSTGDPMLDGLRKLVKSDERVAARKSLIIRMAPTLLGEFSVAIRKVGDLNTLNTEDLLGIVKKYERMVDYFAQMNLLKSSSGRQLRTLGLQIGETPVPQKFMKGADDSAVSAADVKLSEELKNAGGSMSETRARRKVIKELEKVQATISNASSLQEQLGAFNDLSKAKLRGKPLGMTMEYWLGNLLMGFKTHIVNAAGNAAVATLRPLESLASGGVQAVGAVFGYGDFQKAGAAVMRAHDEIGAAIEMFGELATLRTKSDVFTAVRKVVGGGESTLLGEGGHELTKITGRTKHITAESVQDSALGSIARHMMGPEGDKIAGAVGAVTGSVARSPMRALEGSDEFFKQLNFRMTMKADLKAAGRARGLHGKALHEFVATESKRALRRGQAVTRKVLWNESIEKASTELGAEASDLVKLHARTDELMTEAMDMNGVSLGISERSAGKAKEYTFTDELDGEGILDSGGRAVMGLAAAHPQLRFFATFIQTPLNLAKFAGKRSLAEPIWGIMKYAAHQIKTGGKGMQGLENSTSEMLRIMSAGTKEQQADLAGRFGIAMGSTMGLGVLAAHHMENLSTPPGQEKPHLVSIVGRGPLDPLEKKAWLAAGNRESTINVGSMQFDISRLDPFATLLGLVADTMQYSYFSAEDGDHEAYTTAITTALTRNFMDKTYLSGLDNLMTILKSEEPEKIQQILNGYAGSFAPGGAMVAQVNQSAFDGELKEIRTSLDAAMSRYPMWSDKVEARRNILGEKMKRVGWNEGDAWISRVLPFPVTDSEKADPLMQELAALNHPWRHSSEKMRMHGQTVDLLTYTAPNGSTANDRYKELVSEVEMGGMKIRERLETLFTSEAYKELPYPHVDDVKQGPRVGAVASLLAAYRAGAKAALLEEMPEIADDVRKRLGVNKQTTAARSIFN